MDGVRAVTPVKLLVMLTRRRSESETLPRKSLTSTTTGHDSLVPKVPTTSLTPPPTPFATFVKPIKACS